jgi:hypothetical protein
VSTDSRPSPWSLLLSLRRSPGDIPNAKPIIDAIDAVLAEHYGFTAEELDFIINYDIKYRLGAETDE